MKLFIALFILLLLFTGLSAQEGGDTLDWDISSIFDEPFLEPTVEEPLGTATQTTVDRLLRQPGYRTDIAFGLVVGQTRGWNQNPLHPLEYGESYLENAIIMYNAFSIDAQISDEFRARVNMSFQLPNFAWGLGDFFFDYVFYDRVFFRGGKFNLGWGISPNFGFADILARVPIDGYSGDSYIFRIDMPIGVGGIQALAMTRANMVGGVMPKTSDFGYGGKYNLALRRIDLDLGFYNQDDMPMRGFLSTRTNFRNTDFYNEWLFVLDTQEEESETSFAVNIGFSRSFFNGRLSLNGELFFNGEGNALWYRPETWLRESEVSPFIEGFNGAFNLAYSFEGRANPRLFVQARYSHSQESTLIIPSFSLNPFPNIYLYIAAPMALGSREGYYYLNTTAVDDIGRPLPFSIYMGVTLNGSVSFGHY